MFYSVTALAAMPFSQAKIDVMSVITFAIERDTTFHSSMFLF